MNSPQVIMSPFHYAAMLGVKIRYHRKKRIFWKWYKRAMRAAGKMK